MNYPFPGLDPWMEHYWSDVHTALIGLLREQLAERLPSDLLVRAEERLTVDEPDGQLERRADVAVTESWKHGISPAWSPEGETPSGAGAAVAEPYLVLLDPETQRWLEIRARDGRLVTAIEILSPANKRAGAGLEAYLARRRAYLQGRVNLVEIDLLRGGSDVLLATRDLLPAQAGVGSRVCVSRAIRPEQAEVYVFPLRDPIRPFRVPLRPGETDVVAELQPLLERCYRSGRYWLADHSRPLDPPLPPDDAAWAEECLRQAGL